MTYEYIKLPFGTAISSAIFCKIIRHVLYTGKPPLEHMTQIRQNPEAVRRLNYVEHQRTKVDVRIVRSYVDDVLVSTPSEDFHIQLDQIEAIFRHILASGMTLSIDKSEFFTNEIKFLGHKLHPNYITKNFDKKTFFVNFEKQYYQKGKLAIPGKRVIQKVIGFFNWFSRFIPDYGALINPFLTLLSMPTPYKLTLRTQ